MIIYSHSTNIRYRNKIRGYTNEGLDIRKHICVLFFIFIFIWICTVCGKILNYRDFEKEELDLVRKTEEILAHKHGFLIRDHNIEFLGLCADCRPGGKRSTIPAR